MKYSLNILPRAENDFQRMFSYIAARSPDGAERWKLAFETAAGKLSENPHIHGLAPEDRQFDFELRQPLFKTRQGRTYRAVYRIVGDEIVVFRLRGPGQAPFGLDDVASD